MWSFKLFFVCFSLQLAISQGYLFFIKNKSSKQSVCYTNETGGAITFIKQLTNSNPQKIQLDNDDNQIPYTNIDGVRPKLSSYNCDLFESSGCDGWEIGDFSIHSNLADDVLVDSFEPVADIRWHRFKTVLTHGVYKIEELKTFSRANKRFHTSVLAIHSPQFLFSPIKNYSRGYMIGIDGWGGRISRLRYCSYVPPDAGSTCNLEALVENNNSQIFLNRGNDWSVVTTLFEAVPYDKFLFRTTVNERPVISWNKWDVSDKSKALLYLGVRSYVEKALFKLHEYDYLQPKSRNSEMFTTLILNETQALCFDIIYYTKHGVGFTVKIGNELTFDLEAKSSPLKSWSTRRIITDPLDAGNHLIVIEAKKRYDSFLGGVYFCSGEATLVKSNDNLSRSCRILENDGPYSKTSESLRTFLKEERPPLSTSESVALCRALGSEDCAGIEICDQMGCFCISGYWGSNCSNKCSFPKYGPACGYMSGFCKSNNQSHHDGTCLRGCYNDTYRMPYCKEKLLQFDTLPAINVTGAYDVEMNFEYSVNALSDGFEEYFGHTEITCKKDNDYESDIKLNVTREKLSIVHLTNLEPKSGYICVFPIIEKDGQSVKNDLNTAYFTTKPCIPLNKENFEITFGNSGFKIRKKESDVKDSCHLEKVILSSDNSDSAPLERIFARTSRGVDFTEDIHFNFDTRSSYTLTFIGQDSGVFFIEHAAGTKESGTVSTVIGIVIFLIVLIILVAAMLFWRRRKRIANNTNQRLVDDYLNQRPINTVELDLVPAPERSAARKSFVEATADPFSKVIKVSELDEYVETAMKTNLLKTQHEQFPRGQTQSWTVGIDPANKKKNRYANLAAYDATRVKLEPLVDSDEQSDYINANYIDGYKRPRAYIATQGPKPQTVVDFWRMIWQEKVGVIVMCANLVENGKAKCEKYWPDVQKNAQHGNFIIKNSHEEFFADYICRTLTVSFDNASRRVVQMHYTTWPDHGVPLYPQSVSSFAKKLIQTKTESPITVHCSAGVGRTGTVILIDACLRMATAEGNVDILGLLAKMRNQRANLVDNAQQYEFVHMVLLETLVVPQFAIPCKNFQNDFAVLTARNKFQISKQFEKLNEICEKEWNRSDNAAQMDSDKCRYPEIIASSNHLVKIYPYGSISRMSFFNGVYVDGFQKKRQYIATQAPLPNTVEHFWRIVHQHAVKQILVLNAPGPMEGYYVPQIGEHLTFGDFKVTAMKEIETKHCFVKTINIAPGTNQPFMTHVSSYNWPAEEIPGPSVSDLVEIWEQTERTRGDKVSIIVCHDGVTTSGLFLGVGFVLEKIKLEQQVDTALAMRTLRQSRPKFIAHQEQFETLYQAASVYLEAFDTYGNFQ